MTVRLPAREERARIEPPSCYSLVLSSLSRATSCRTSGLPVAFACSRRNRVRIAAFERLTWGDVDEPECRWRVSETGRFEDGSGEVETVAEGGCSRRVLEFVSARRSRSVDSISSLTSLPIG